jgi:hypothetical protein
MIISYWIILRMKNVSNKSWRQNQNTHFTFNNFFRKSYRLWCNVDEYGKARQATDDDIMRRRKDAICLLDNKSKDTNLHSYYLILIAFPRQKWVIRTLLNYVIRTLPVVYKMLALLRRKSGLELHLFLTVLSGVAMSWPGLRRRMTSTHNAMYCTFIIIYAKLCVFFTTLTTGEHKARVYLRVLTCSLLTLQSHERSVTIPYLTWLVFGRHE